METFNYFNYFTEIEEYFWRKRGAHLLVSPLDWAIVETWQKAGVPLEAVLKGIDRAFESWSRSRRAAGGRQLKSLAYCVDAVLDAAEEASEAAAGAGPEIKRSQPDAEPFSRDELKKYFERNAARLRAAAEKRRATHAGLATRLGETAKRLDEAPFLEDGQNARHDSATDEYAASRKHLERKITGLRAENRHENLQRRRAERIRHPIATASDSFGC